MVRLRAILGYGLMGAGFLLGGILMVLFMSILFLPLGFVIIILGAFLARGTEKEYKKLYKEIFIERPLIDSFDNLRYDWKRGFSNKTVENFLICRMGNKFYSEDLVQGASQGISFEMSDVWVRHHSAGRKKTSTYFRGKVIVFELPNANLGSVQVFTKNYKNRTTNQPTVYLQNVVTGNMEFDKLYAVDATAPQDVQYLLTPHFMEHLCLLTRRFQSVAVHAYGNKMVLALRNDFVDSLDAKSVFKRVSYQKEVAKVNEEINDIRNVCSLIYDLGSTPYISQVRAADPGASGGFVIEYSDNAYKYIDNAL